MEVGQLLNLQVLAFNGNELTGLYLDDTRIATLFKTHVSPSCLGSIPAELAQLSNLEVLLIHKNQLAGLYSSGVRVVALFKLYNSLFFSRLDSTTVRPTFQTSTSVST